MDLVQIGDALEQTHGATEPHAVRDPFEMALWENVAYLVNDGRRGAAFTGLKTAIGLTPDAILEAPVGVIAAAIADGGMKPEMRAEKLKRCSEVAQEIGLDTLRELVATAPDKARRLLKRFPGIGDPGADKILLVAGTMRTLALDSNGLRVLVRIGYGEESRNYSATYRSIDKAVQPELPDDSGALWRLHQLLRTHGKEMCTRSRPACEPCPLSRDCAFNR